MPKQRLSFFKTIWMRSKTWFQPWVVVLTIGLVALAGFGLWYHLESRPTSAHKTAIFQVDSGQNALTIGRNLQSAGFIRNAYAFEIYAAFHGYLRKMQSGVYLIPAQASVPQIAVMIANGKISTKRLTIPEGDTVAKIRQLAIAAGIKGSDFDQAITASYPSYPFLQNRATTSLEGYLFPDSYTITPKTTASQLITMMLTTFNAKVTSYTQAFAAEGLTLNQGLTLASMIEKEVANSADRPIVAQVFLKRLKAGQPLQSDVTVDYAANLLGVPFNTSLNSPYNTYANTGLPIGPICNPGLSAINAAAHPASTDYSYFVAGKDGKTYFATTFAQQEANIAQYAQ